MKAVILHGPNNYPDNFEVMEIEKPVCGDDDIILEMKAAAICGTDKRIFTGAKTKGVRPDSVPGHEMCGDIAEVGKNVKGFKVGDRVAIANVIPCGHCPSCLSGRENACTSRQAIGYEFNGGFEEFIRIPDVCIKSGNVVKIPETTSYAAGALIEPLACCIRGQKNAGTKFNDTVLIIGAGPIGLMHVQLSKISGARKVIISDIDTSKTDIALKTGADVAINPKEDDLTEVVMRETNGEGVDVVIMAVGVNAMVDTVFKLVKRGGTCCLFAGFPNGKMSEFDPSVIHYNEINVTGSTAYKRSDYLEAAAMVTSGKLDMDALVSHKFKLADFKKAFEKHMEATGLKIVVEP